MNKGESEIVIATLEKIELAVRRTAANCVWTNTRDVQEHLAKEIARIIKDTREQYPD